jgi:hypothetical protein
VSSRGARAARGAAIAGFATFAAALAHTVGGGTPPGLLAILVSLAFSAPLAMLLAGGRGRLVRAGISTLAAQASLHLCYAVLGGAGLAVTGVGAASGGTAGAGTSAHAGHAGHGSPAALGDALATPALVDHGHEFMPLTHALAAALTLLALVAGDRVLRAVGRAVRLFVRRITSMPAAVVVASPRLAPTGERPTLIAHLPHAALSSRGPPVVAVVS